MTDHNEEYRVEALKRAYRHGQMAGWDDAHGTGPQTPMGAAERYPGTDPDSLDRRREFVKGYRDGRANHAAGLLPNGDPIED